MRQRLFSSLIFKVGLIIIPVEIVVLISTGTYYTRRFNEAVDARVYDRAEIPGNLMARGMLGYEVVTDRERMTELVGDDLVEAMVVAVTGKVFYSFHTEYEGRDASQVPGLSSAWFSPSVTESFILDETEDGDNYLVSVTPIFAGESKKPYYFFYLKVSTNQAAQEKRNITGLFLTGALACVVLTSLAILFTFRVLISRRLSVTLDGLERFKDGDLDARIKPVTSNDEIAILQRGVNSMAAEFQETIGNLEMEVAERVRAKERAQRLLEQQITVNQLALALGETRDLVKIYHTIHQHIQALVDTWGFVVSFYDDETRLIRAEYVMHRTVNLDVTSFPPIPLAEPGQGVQSRVIHTGEPLYTPDHRKAMEASRTEYVVEENGTISEGPPPEEGEQEGSTKSALYVPMKVEGKTIGVMQLQSPQLDAYTQESIDLLAGMANVAAVAIQNARLYDAVQQELAERKRAEEELERYHKHLEDLVEERTAQLEAVNEELKDFAYTVSHDLKAPLRAISQLANWISADYADVLDQEGQEMLHLLIGRTKRMHDLIAGILQYSRIGRVTEEEKIVDLNQLAQETIEMLAPPEHIQITVKDELPTVTGERTRLGQVLQNLFDNAVKFMDKPEGQISLCCVDEGPHWLFSVADNGPGIEKKYHTKTFQMFQTLAPRDEFESTGVGLPLVKKIVEAWGGRVWVESTLGEGSTFYFTLPKKRREK